jgi:hypothetical protein
MKAKRAIDTTDFGRVVGQVGLSAIFHQVEVEAPRD